MDTTVERVEENKVKLTVTVEADRVDQAVDEAARNLAQQVTVPGFRPGRVPRRVLESRVGREALEQEAASHAIPRFYQEAVQAEELQVVGQPELDVDTFASGKQAVFTATVEVLPEIEPPEVDDLQIAYPDWEVTEDDVTEQLDTLRERFAELETVERPIQPGDHAKVTITAERSGERVDEASGEDLLYAVDDPDETDSEIDRQLVGAKAGQVLKFSDTLGDDFGEGLAGTEVDFTVIVKEVKAQRLPELTDEFVDDNTEFDTVAELDGELRRQLDEHKRAHAAAELRSKVVEAVADRVEVTLPEALVQQELQFRVQRLSQEAEQHGLSIDQYLQALGAGEDVFSQLDQQARATVKAQLVLDAIARDAGIDVEQTDLEDEVHRQAERLGRPATEIAEMMNHPDRIGALVSDTYRRKTIDHLLERVQVLGGPPPDEDADDAETPDDVHADAEATGETDADAATAEEAPEDDPAATEARERGDG